MTGSLSIFDAAREASAACAVVAGATELTFAELARRTAPRCVALLHARPRALALTPHATVDSLLWLYAAFATGTPLLMLHTRATQSERHQAARLVGAVAPPVVDDSDLAPALPRELDERGPLVFIPTSGSTGTPRLVELSRAAAQASARASAANLGWNDGDRWLLCLPLAHTGGLSVVIRCLLARRSVVLFEPGPAGLLADAARLADVARSCTLLSLVPSTLAALLDVGFAAPDALRAVLLGGSGCSPALARRAHAARIPLLTSYGLTETASQVVTRRYAERLEPLPELHGRVSSGHALPGVELTLRDGRIAVRAPSLLTGYVGPHASDSAVDAAGWLLTADRGELGRAGELYVLGRSDDVIVTAGENVDVHEVEAALLALRGVSAACVLGTASEQFGAVVSALLVTTDAALADPARLAEQLAYHLARHKHPRRVKLVESLPLTPSGKLDRRACAALFDDHHPSG
jgi:O-succinylbenzoic acid--CoA ligase